MPFSVGDIVYRVVQSFDRLDETNALTLINDIHREIVNDVRIYPDSQQDISLVAGTKLYNLPADLVRLWSAVYIDGTTQGQPMVPTNVDELDYKNPTWRTAPNSRPFFYYERAGQIGFHPTPDTTSSGGVPTVRIYYATVSANDLEIGDTLPDTVKSIDAWVYGACLKHAIQASDQRISLFATLFSKAMNDALSWNYGRTPRDKPSIRYNSPRINRY